MDVNRNNYASCLISFVLYFLLFGYHKEKYYSEFHSFENHVVVESRGVGGW